MDFDLSTIAAYGAGGAFLAHWCTNGLTLSRPERPSWVAFLAAALFSIGFVALMTLANAPDTTVWTPKVWANVVLVGLLGAAGAAGASVTQASATAKREKAMAGATQAEPDVSSPQPQVKQ